MSKFLTLAIAFVVGLGAGGTIRYAGAVQQAYRQGYAAGLAACRREAIIEGHGDWVFPVPGDSSVSPVWQWRRDNRPDYNPENRQFIKGAVDNPDPTSAADTH